MRSVETGWYLPRQEVEDVQGECMGLVRGNDDAKALVYIDGAVK